VKNVTLVGLSLRIVSCCNRDTNLPYIERETIHIKIYNGIARFPATARLSVFIIAQVATTVVRISKFFHCHTLE